MSRKYQVQPGDVLTKIAQRFYGEATLFGLIAAANQLSDPNKIAPGQVLAIPDLPGHWDVVQVTGSNQIRATGALAVQIPCNVPVGMRLVIETVSAQCVQQPGVLFPLILGELDPLNRPVQPLAFFPWVQSFDSADIKDGDPRWFALHTATHLYVAGPADHLTFSAGFIGPEPNQAGFAEVYVCVNGYLEAAPTA
jgi:LysM repeat protein